MAFYEINPNLRPVACLECGCVVDGSERGRELHGRFHAAPAAVIDLAVQEVERVA